MPETFAWSESNGVTPTVNDAITNLNFGNVDAADLVVNTYPIVAGELSYEKNIRAKFGGTFTEISNIKLFKSAGAYKTGEVINANCVATYVQPVKTASSRAVNPIPTEVGSAIAVLAANGDATIVAPGYTRYVCLQLVTTASTPSGVVNSKTIELQYDVV